MLKVSAAINLAFANIDQRAVVGLAFVLIAFSMLGSPSFGAAALLAQVGVSPRGYAYIVGAAGALILRWPRSRFYTLLTLVFMPYWLALLVAVAEQGASATPIIVYSLAGYFVLRAQ